MNGPQADGEKLALSWRFADTEQQYAQLDSFELWFNIVTP